MAVYHEIKAADLKPALNQWVTCIDVNNEYRIGRWTGEVWQSRDLNSTESPAYAPVVKWLQKRETYYERKIKNSLKK
jgi:hypothetical protein